MSRADLSFVTLTGFLLAALACIALGACTPPEQPEQESSRLQGGIVEIGIGTVETYADTDADGALSAVGVVFSDGAFDELPDEITDGHRCFDSNGDGEIDPHAECSAWHERVLPLPSEISRRDDVPFKWVLLNWNNHGHIPPGVWDVPHFDVHFYIESIEKIFSLQRGDCGPEFLRCDQFEIATRPVPEPYMHADYVDVGAAAPAMGNHLVDTTAAEFHGEPFTRSWIYGAYDGEVIFYEEMLALNYLRSEPQDCYPIKTPPTVRLS
ncbi:MAG: hypothetical protein WD423_14860, partial [Rhodothermales bacterium]